MPAVSLVPSQNIDQFWPHVREGFHEACMATGGDLTTGDLWNACRHGPAFLVIVHEGEQIIGAAVYRADNWSSGRKLRPSTCCCAAGA